MKTIKDIDLSEEYIEAVKSYVCTCEYYGYPECCIINFL